MPLISPFQTCLESVDQIKDLGVTITKDLSWSLHVAIIVSKANKALGIIQRTVGPVDKQVFPMLYKSLVICRSSVVFLFS